MNQVTIHLTEQGFHAGRRLCLTDRHDGQRNVHAAYAPLNDPKFRAQVCQSCMKAWAEDAYEQGDQMPDYIRQLRADPLPAATAV